MICGKLIGRSEALDPLTCLPQAIIEKVIYRKLQLYMLIHSHAMPQNTVPATTSLLGFIY